MSHGTLSNEFPGWYVTFQTDVLSQLPRPGELSEDVADGWHSNRESMKKVLRDTLCPPAATETAAEVIDLPQPAPLPMSIVINADGTPFIPSGLSLTGKGAEHRGMGTITLEKRDDGQLYVNGVKVERYLSPNQKDGNVIKGYELAKELKDEQTLNARILDAVYENQQLIPDGWENGLTYFWATKFRGALGIVCVGCLCRIDGQWCRHYRWLGSVWRGNGAARLEKPQTSDAQAA